MDDPKVHKKALQEERKHYAELKKLKNSEEFGVYFNLLVEVATKRTLDLVTAGAKDWEDFQKQRGEIIGFLYPVQEAGAAEAMEKKVKETYEQYYKNEEVDTK